MPAQLAKRNLVKDSHIYHQGSSELNWGIVLLIKNIWSLMSSSSILLRIRYCNPDFQIGITWIDPLDIFEEVLDLSLPLKILNSLKLHDSGEEKKKTLSKIQLKTYLWKFTQQRSNVYEKRQLNFPTKIASLQKNNSTNKKKTISQRVSLMQ